jgi:hypothetical protein
MPDYFKIFSQEGNFVVSHEFGSDIWTFDINKESIDLNKEDAFRVFDLLKDEFGSRDS